MLSIDLFSYSWKCTDKAELRQTCVIFPPWTGEILGASVWAAHESSKEAVLIISNLCLSSVQWLVQWEATFSNSAQSLHQLGVTLQSRVDREVGKHLH